MNIYMRFNMTEV